MNSSPILRPPVYDVIPFADFLIELIYGVKSLDDLENDSLPRDIPNTETNAIPSNVSIICVTSFIWG